MSVSPPNVPGVNKLYREPRVTVMDDHAPNSEPHTDRPKNQLWPSSLSFVSRLAESKLHRPPAASPDPQRRPLAPVDRFSYNNSPVGLASALPGGANF